MHTMFSSCLSCLWGRVGADPVPWYQWSLCERCKGTGELPVLQLTKTERAKARDKAVSSIIVNYQRWWFDYKPLDIFYALVNYLPRGKARVLFHKVVPLERRLRAVEISISVIKEGHYGIEVIWKTLYEAIALVGLTKVRTLLKSTN